MIHDSKPLQNKSVIKIRWRDRPLIHGQVSSSRRSARLAGLRGWRHEIMGARAMPWLPFRPAGSMTLDAGFIQSSDASMWGFCWSRPLTIGPTRLRSGLGFADPHDQQMGLMTHSTAGFVELGNGHEPRSAGSMIESADSLAGFSRAVFCLPPTSVGG